MLKCFNNSSYNYLILFFIIKFLIGVVGEDIIGCGGFVKSSFYINYSRVEVKLYTKQGSLKYHTDCAPHNGYYLIPLYDKGDYVLKIEPPEGWKFEPESVSLHVDGTTDPCSRNQDINFSFKGFTVFGQVLSSNQDKGPAGIKVVLKKNDGEILHDTVTVENGIYTFSEVLPGNYIIEASHSKWLFEQNIEEIKIGQDNIKKANKIVVAGFDVKGHVYSEGEPIQGVHFLLFSKQKPLKKLTSCNTGKITGVSEQKNLFYLCYATSIKDGSFVFPSLPSAKYTLVPFYKGENIEFDVSPSEVEFEVKDDSFEFSNNFQVEGFSVSGRVLESTNGKGLEGAEIYINGKQYTKTEAGGIYHLENMRAGVYDIEVKMDHIYFDKVSMKVTPSSPHLPEVFASKFSICGRIYIKLYPLGPLKTDRTIILKNIKSNSVINVPVSNDGEFCTQATPGQYEIEPSVSDSEKNSGLVFIPKKHLILLEYKPLFDIVFTQFMATVQGQIECIGKCVDLRVSIMSDVNPAVYFSATVADDGKFTVEGCLPGDYILTVEKSDYCFDSNSVEFKIQDKDILNLKLRQTGFLAKIVLSHMSTFTVKYPSKTTKNYDLSVGLNNLCLPESGVYEFTPIGCHLYASAVFKYDTNNPSQLSLTPSKYRITGTVVTELNDSNIHIFIQKEPNTNPEVILLKDPIKLKDNTFQYDFLTYIEPNTNLEIKTNSSLLLFSPDIATVQVHEDCIINAIKIIGKKGLFIDGFVSPVLENVKIKILNKKNNNVIHEVLTDKSGTFKVGPLNNEDEYIVTAEKEGYFFTPQGKLGSFKAYKLAEIVVKVENEQGKPLPGVLLSLSGGVDYRKNSLTHKDGKISFIGLSPGQYFLRPMLKEYQFQPTTKMIDIKEGTQIQVSISGKRVAYSLFGVVNSLTGESEVGVTVEAVGINSPCNLSQEDAISEQGGIFRIRGLQPNCTYSLRLKEDGDVNQHIERATPKEHIFTVQNYDITDIRIIVFRHFSQLDVSGHVFTNQEYLSTLKVRLFSYDNPDQVLQTVTLGQSAFFYLSSLPIDQKLYILRLGSSLPTSSYTYDSPYTIFKANTSFHHFSFEFDPQPKSSDQEVTQGSILALPFTLLVIFIFYNYQKVYTFLSQSVQSIGLRTSYSNDTSSDNSNTRKKVKPRRT